MFGDLNAPLSALTVQSRNLLSTLLNTRKVLPSVGSDRIERHRDWRGLASLANISFEIAASINDYPDKTAKLLDIWIQRNDGTATVARLIDYLQEIDRCDVYDDLLDLAAEEKLIVKQANDNQVVILDGTDEDIITYDDKKFGTPQTYHAYVLYAKEDKEFVDELLYRMRHQGFKLCTEDDLVAGHATQFAPVSRLIAERCRYIILVYSPDFLRSPAIAFYMNLAQADGINKNQHKIIPIMYRYCVLPQNLSLYYALKYPAPGTAPAYDFWNRLALSISTVHMPRLNSASSTHSEVNIAEISSQRVTNSLPQVNGHQHQHLALPEVPTEASSLNDLHHLRVETPNSAETRSLSGTSQTSESKKKGPFRKILSAFSGKKHKKAIAVEN